MENTGDLSGVSVRRRNNDTSRGRGWVLGVLGWRFYIPHG